MNYNIFNSFHDNIENITVENNYFRRVITTTPNLQLVVMSLNPLEDIGNEIHPYTTQFIRVEEGTGIATFNGADHELYPGVAVIITPNTYHNVVNTSNDDPLKLYTIYSPPNHAPDKIDIIKPLND